MTRLPTTEWLRWSVAIGELERQRDLIPGHRHSLGPDWERGVIDELQRRIDALRVEEPVKYAD